MASNKKAEEPEVRAFEEPQTKVKTTAAEPEAKSDTTPKQLIYIGPSIRKNGVGIRTNQVFIGGHPEYFKALYAEYPHFKQLFVPVDQLQESLKQIKQTGTVLNTALLSLKGV